MTCDCSFFARCTQHNRSLSNLDPFAGVSSLEIVPPSCPHPSVSSGNIVMGSVWFSSSSDPLKNPLSVQLFYDLLLDFGI
ncbi:hypothetical protein EUGRSUZ_F01522 [Eucalyptus grandis]|uniref:Uncharacterized protein n=2 Tax=Eucalyptus grandis TaxID=71139 RepID=A0ACC3KGU1_EUCGR|nr:hypothetical protein EUGRSUZ_F01522 [Eucalyptus grandis]